MTRASFTTLNSFRDLESKHLYLYSRDSTSLRKALNLEDVTKSELEEEIHRKLESVDPLAARNVVNFNFKTGNYENAPPPSPVINFLHYESAAIFKNAPDILDFDDTFDFNEIFPSHSTYNELDVAEELSNDVKASLVGKSSTEEEHSQEPETVQAIYMAARPHKERKIPNAFNFCEEATQTITPVTRSVETETIPPLTGQISSTVGPSIIFDAYARDFEKHVKLKRESSHLKVPNKQMEEENANPVKFAERVVCQNIFDEVGHDFRYYEDPADEFRSDGRLLPLWRFFLPNQHIPVTDLDWSTGYYDLLAVTFGAVDYDHSERFGAVALISLKNPLYPEYLRKTNSPALCLSMHHSHSNLLVVGLYDGHIEVYDTASNDLEPQYKSDSISKHFNGVYAVKWRKSDELNFYSLSVHGYVKSWMLMATSLEATTLRIIQVSSGPQVGPEGVALDIRGSGFRFQFHPAEKNVYLVGTAEGLITKCSLLKTSECIFIYKAHYLPVHRIAYNPYLSSIFLSCSSDWTVKLWEDERREPLLVFDLQYPVTDVDWAPYTSTVFAAATSNGFVHVFDLNISCYRPIHKQQAVSTLQDNKPTRIKFNKASPVLVIGDEKGRLTSLKFSPNLRIPAKASKKDTLTQEELELRKLKRVLGFIKPKVLQPPSDTPSILT